MREDESTKGTHCPLRRDMLRLALTAAVSSVAIPEAIADPRIFLGPQIGDLFVAANPSGMIVGPGELRTGGPPVLAWPMDARTRIIRNGSRLNQILLLRLKPNGRSAGSASSAYKIAAFSAICTHAGCAVSEWRPLTRHLLCPCHGSEYDPQQRAQVVFGPAPRPLPDLGVAVIKGMLQVTAAFTDRLGGSTSRTD